MAALCSLREEAKTLQDENAWDLFVEANASQRRPTKQAGDQVSSADLWHLVEPCNAQVPSKNITQKACEGHLGTLKLAPNVKTSGTGRIWNLQGTPSELVSPRKCHESDRLCLIVLVIFRQASLKSRFFKAVRRGFAMASLSRKVAPAPCDGLYAVALK